MDDSLRRLSFIAAIAALGAGGASAQSPLPSVRYGDVSPRRDSAMTFPPADASLTRLAQVPGRPTPLPPIGTTSGSGIRLGLPVEKVSTPVRANALALAGSPVAGSRVSPAVDLSEGTAAPRRYGRLVSDSGGEGRGDGLEKPVPTQPAAASMTVVQLLRRSDQMTQEAELALRRGAVHSSREAALRALQFSAAAADMRSGGRDATGALEQAAAAIREVGDFVGRYGHVDAADLQRMVDAHQTPVLKGCDTADLSPQAAADAYLDFARQRLITAASGRGEAAASLGVLARAERVHGEVHGDAHSALSESVAIAYMRAAVGTDPGSAPLANELGYQAMRLGLLGEAQWALERSWAIEPSEPALRNLIETHRLAGDTARARQLVAMLPQFAAEAKSDLPDVVRVDPGEFAAISPPVQSAVSGAHSGTGAQAVATHPGPLRTQPSTTEEGTAGAQRRQDATPPAADESSSVLGRVAGAVRKMWH